MHEHQAEAGILQAGEREAAVDEPACAALPPPTQSMKGRPKQSAVPKKRVKEEVLCTKCQGLKGEKVPSSTHPMVTLPSG